MNALTRIAIFAALWGLALHQCFRFDLATLRRTCKNTYSIYITVSLVSNRLTYWLIYVGFTLFESLMPINMWKPLYYPLKYTILIWCQESDNCENGTTLLQKLIQVPLPSHSDVVAAYTKYKLRLLTWFGKLTLNNRLKTAPHEFLCPISHEVMKDPVICADGHTYERSSIESWFKHSHTSPKTNEELISTALIPNHALRNVIQEYLNE